MSYGIMRIEKRKRAAVYGLQIEANRTQEDHVKGREFDGSDIEWEKTSDNIHLVQTKNWNKEISNQIAEAGLKTKKDSVVMLDGVYTASPEWFENHSKEEAIEYFKAALKFHVDHYCGGDQSRVINAVIHFDEKTPHMQVASVPIIEDERGKHLSAKIIVGGRDDLRKKQDQFFEEVTQPRGMERGQIHDKTEKKLHKTKRQYELEQIERRERELELRQSEREQRERTDAGLKLVDEARRELNLPDVPHEVIPAQEKTLFKPGQPEKVVLTREDYDELRRRKITPVALMEVSSKLIDMAAAANSDSRLAKAEQRAKEAEERQREAENALKATTKELLRVKDKLEETLNIEGVMELVEEHINGGNDDFKFEHEW